MKKQILILQLTVATFHPQGEAAEHPQICTLKPLMIISVIYMSQNYLKSTSFGAAINNAAGNITKTGENQVI